MSNKENIEVVETVEATEEKKTPAKKAPAKKTAEAPAKEAPARKKLKPVDRNELVEVKSCVYGSLEYISYATGSSIKWETFGDTNWVTVSDLMEIRNSQRAFFEKQWIMPVGDNAGDVIAYLQLDKYYKTFSSLESFDEIFSYDPSEIPAVIAKLSDSTKETIARRAYALIESGELDSNKMITALQDALGYDLTEPQ